MSPRTAVRRLLTAVLLAAATGAWAQDAERPSGDPEDGAPSEASPRDLTRARLSFADGPRLSTRSALRNWVAKDLRNRLGLKESDGLVADEESHAIGDYNVRRIAQMARGLPIVYRESRLILSSEQSACAPAGPSLAFFRQAIGNSAIVPRRSLDHGRWRRRGGQRAIPPSPVLAGQAMRYGLPTNSKACFPNAPQRIAAFERVYVDAQTGDVLQSPVHVP